MAAADIRDELTCSICKEIYTDPVSLPCGHNFCWVCIGKAWDWQESIEEDPSCPECRQRYRRQPELKRNLRLSNIAERLYSSHPEQDGTGIFCTNCIYFPVPAAKSCLLCEVSLCDAHVKVHNKSAEHVLTEPTTSMGNRKCSVHNELLKYYCCEDGVCICTSCCLAGEHKGHRVEPLNEASEKKKGKLRNVLEKLNPEIEETERRAQRLQKRRREVEIKAVSETERVTALFKGIREHLEALEKQLLYDISRLKGEHSQQLWDQFQQLGIKKDELSKKIHHIEELCNMADPLTVLQEQESDGTVFYGADGADNEGRESADIKVPAVEGLDVGLISETLLTGLTGIVTGIKKRWIYGQEATDMLLDINTAENHVSLSGDRKTASYSHTEQCLLNTPERFQNYSQVLSTRNFPSGQHCWEVEGSESGEWCMGVAYPSIERGGRQSFIGDNSKSWCLCMENNSYSVRHDSKGRELPHYPSCRRIRISLDYEAGCLSFYELSEPIRHLHTFTASFTEPLHAAFLVWWADSFVKILS